MHIVHGPFLLESFQSNPRFFQKPSTHVKNPRRLFLHAARLVDKSNANPALNDGSQRGAKKPTGMIEIATKFLPGPTNREHRELIRVTTMSLGNVRATGSNVWSVAGIYNPNYKLRS